MTESKGIDGLTEKRWKSMIKKAGCFYAPLWQARSKYANLPRYLRVYCKVKK